MKWYPPSFPTQGLEPDYNSTLPQSQHQLLNCLLLWQRCNVSSLQTTPRSQA